MQARTLSALLLLTCAFAGCDTSGKFADCTSDDAGAASGSRLNACPESVFTQEDQRAREVSGIVRRGEEVVAGAAVRVDSTFADDGDAGRLLHVASTVTDSVGAF